MQRRLIQAELRQPEGLRPDERPTCVEELHGGEEAETNLADHMVVGHVGVLEEQLARMGV